MLGKGYDRSALRILYPPLPRSIAASRGTYDANENQVRRPVLADPDFCLGWPSVADVDVANIAFAKRLKDQLCDRGTRTHPCCLTSRLRCIAIDTMLVLMTLRS